MNIILINIYLILIITIKKLLNKYVINTNSKLNNNNYILKVYYFKVVLKLILF